MPSRGAMASSGLSRVQERRCPCVSNCCCPHRSRLAVRSSSNSRESLRGPPAFLQEASSDGPIRLFVSSSCDLMSRRQFVEEGGKALPPCTKNDALVSPN